MIKILKTRASPGQVDTKDERIVPSTFSQLQGLFVFILRFAEYRTESICCSVLGQPEPQVTRSAKRLKW